MNILFSMYRTWKRPHLYGIRKHLFSDNISIFNTYKCLQRVDPKIKSSERKIKRKNL